MPTESEPLETYAFVGLGEDVGVGIRVRTGALTEHEEMLKVKKLPTRVQKLCDARDHARCMGFSKILVQDMEDELALSVYFADTSEAAGMQKGNLRFNEPWVSMKDVHHCHRIGLRFNEPWALKEGTPRGRAQPLRATNPELILAADCNPQIAKHGRLALRDKV